MITTCKHEQFSAKVNVIRLEDTGKFTADIKIHCAQCEMPFRFLGLPSGCHPTQPMVSVDATELSAPIAPGRGPLAQHSKFTVDPKAL